VIVNNLPWVVCVALLGVSAATPSAAAASTCVLPGLTQLTSVRVSPIGLQQTVLFGEFIGRTSASNRAGDLAGLVQENFPSTGSSVLVFAEHGDGSFQTTPKTTHVDGRAGDMVAGDLNNDRFLDLALTTFESAHPGLQVLLGNGDGSFRPQSTIPLSGFSTSVVTGDFNRDGRLDVAASGSSNVLVLLGNGDGSLRAPIVSLSGSIGLSLITGDFNKDQHLDVAMASL
jgi:hypothetical protein